MLSKNCLRCDSIFSKPINESVKAWNGRHKFCSKVCSNKYWKGKRKSQVGFKKGHTPWHKGTKGLIIANKASFKKGITPWMTGKHHSDKTKLLLSEKLKGRLPNSGSFKPRPSSIPKCVCQICKKIFQPRQRSKSNKYCSRDCMATGFRTGTNIPCKKCGVDVYVRTYWLGRKKFCSTTCWYGYKVGDKADNWQGGITKLNFAIRNSRRYIKWKTQIRIRDNRTCQLCGDPNSFQVDHIKGFALILKKNNITTTREAYKCDELWDMKNGRVLCLECHKQTDNYSNRAKISLKKLIRN